MKPKTTVLLLLIPLTGCQSAKFSSCISPEVTGQVLAADTRQPLANATVRRVTTPYAGDATQPKGGQLLIQPAGVQTDADGRFTLAAQSDLAPFHLFHRSGWHSVAVSFGCAGYENFQTNFAAGRFQDRTAEGVPLVAAGDILLQPKSR